MTEPQSTDGNDGRDGPDPGVPYPSHWEADVVLKDGATAHLRPITPADARALEAFHDAQSSESVYLRFFAPMPHLSARDVRRFTHVDHRDRVAFVCTIGDRIVGIGRYDRIEAQTAEVAFNISDVHQGRGLGSVLLEHLAAAARENNVHTFHAEVLPQNRKMITVFREAGYEVKAHFDDGVISLEFDIDPTERSLAVMEAREHRAEARSMQFLFNPASVAIIGPSRQPGTIGHRLLEDLLAGHFTGRLHVVHRRADSVLGVPAVRRVTDIEGGVDLAVIAVPAAGVLDVVRDCAAAGVRGLIVVSSGFGEAGPEGVERQRKLVQVARANGLRVVGPNSWGVINANDDVRLNVSLVQDMLSSGRLGLFSQSGGLAVAVLDALQRRGLGLSTFLSAGNRADVSGNDCMQFWEEDPNTDVIGLYLESFGNPRKFSRIARRLARQKPVIVVKSGSSGVGGPTLPPGHEVRPSIQPREAIDSMLRQSGCIRVATVPQMLDVAQLLLHQPLPTGPRVGIVGNSDALGALIADACASWQLEVVHMPLALHPQAGPEQFRKALREAFVQPNVDAVVAAFIPPIATQADEVAHVLSEVAGRSEIPLVACFLGTRGVTAELSRGRRVVPSYPTPEEAVRALARATRYAEWKRRDPGHRVEPEGVDVDAARSLVTQWLLALGPIEPGARDWDGVLTPDRVARLLATFGIRLWPEIRVAGTDAAVAAARELGYPVAVKTTAPHLRHRVDLGGVRLDIGDDEELRADVLQMRRVLGEDGGTLVVQAMAPSGVACVIRTAEDKLFGPVVSFGLAGDASDLLGDVAHRIPPLTDVDVGDLVRSVRAAPKLFGHRGATPVDVPALEDLLARVSVLADLVPEVADLELNPVVVSEQGLSVLGGYVRLARPALRADTGRRELPGMTGWPNA